MEQPRWWPTHPTYKMNKSWPPFSLLFFPSFLFSWLVNHSTSFKTGLTFLCFQPKHLPSLVLVTSSLSPALTTSPFNLALS